MKRIGLIGGLGPEATIDYYKGIIDAFKEKSSDLDYPETIIYSVNMREMLDYTKKKEYDMLASAILEKINALISAGVDYIAMTANTPHLVYDTLKEKTEIPIISIVEATCREAKARGLKKPGLFGTGFTMNASFYSDVFKKNGLDLVMPDADDKKLIDYRIFSEIELGVFKEETRQELIRIIEKMVSLRGIDSIILGCTELPLILGESEYARIPVLNTTQIHVKEIVNYCINGKV